MLRILILSVMLCWFLSDSLQAQWSNDPLQNTCIVDMIGLTDNNPGIVTLPDGKCFISEWENPVQVKPLLRLQLYDVQGFKVWNNKAGLLCWQIRVNVID